MFIKIRAGSSGESMFKTNLGSAIAKVLECDYRMDANNPQKHIICVTADGDVTGFIFNHEDTKNMKVSNASAGQQNKIMKELILKKNV